METEGVPFVAAGISVVVTVLTVVATDFFGLRRDKARLKMEFAWQLRRQRWDALCSALQSCPRFVTEPQELLQSISDLANWSATEVEPWIGSDRIGELRGKRETVEAWVVNTLHTVQANSAADIDVPNREINAFRDLANQQLTDALQRIRSEFSPLLKEQKF